MTAAARNLGALVAGHADPGSAAVLPVSGLALDSRAIAPGEVFVALRGTRGHGIDHAHGAVARGASAVLYEPPASPPDLPVPAIAVPGLRAKLGEIAARWFGSPSQAMTVVGVTGTNGKTSTVQLVAQALAGRGARAATIGTLGAGLHGEPLSGERTTPDVITVHRLLAGFRARGVDHVAMEVSSHALDQGRVDAVDFDIAVFTNLTRDHLDYHGTMDAYFEAKAKLFARPGLGAAVVNLDDPWGRRLFAAGTSAARVLGASATGAEGATLRASNLDLGGHGIAFDLDAPVGRGRVVSPLLGRFNVDNLLAVAGVLGALGVDAQGVAGALSRLQPVAGRMNRLGGGSGEPLVVVDYAHTPDALEQALASLRAHTARRLICVFGCGGERDVGKRPQMGAIAERLADVVLVTDDNPRGEDGDAIVAGIVAGFAQPDRVRIVRDRAQAIAEAVALAGEGDTVLVAGKGHEAYQEVAGVRRPFDDLGCAREALAVRR
jgi:UDP-N-acetylmuramoyl-L-alanyl-D-glutamate--2,6-diaminopimelate ligase